MHDIAGIGSAPRIARWKDLKIYKFSGESYPNINPMFTPEDINEDLIAKYLPDMQRVAVSYVFRGQAPTHKRLI
jgi:hypothetical protein